jgi:UDP-glucose 4-epimerase
MRVLVCGGRNYLDSRRVYSVLDKLHTEAGIDHIINGGANGADMLSSDWAAMHGVKGTIYMADWENYGTMAGPLRNQLMLDQGEPDVVIAFAGGRGTADMVKKARRAGVEVIEIAP